MNRLASRRGILAVASGVLAGAVLPRVALAQSTTEPVDTIRSLYARPQGISDAPFLTRRLTALFAAQRRRSQETDDVMPGLDFDYTCGCQDYDDAFKRTLQLVAGARTEATASVVARFRLFDRDTEIAYSLIREDGRWLIDDISGRGENGWTMSRLLQTAN
jgi:hypothetical protein